MNKESRFYTAKEVVEILEKAKALGVISLKLQGFEAAFEVQEEARASQETVESSYRQELCDKCGEKKIEGQYGLYCRACYIVKKENDYKKIRRW